MHTVLSGRQATVTQLPAATGSQFFLDSIMSKRHSCETVAYPKERGGGAKGAIAHLKPEKHKSDFYKTLQTCVKKTDKVKLIFKINK